MKNKTEKIKRFKDFWDEKDLFLLDLGIIPLKEAVEKMLDYLAEKIEELKEEIKKR